MIKGYDEVEDVLRWRTVSNIGEESNSEAFIRSAEVLKSSDVCKGGGRSKLGISKCLNLCSNSMVATDPLVVVPLELDLFS